MTTHLYLLRHAAAEDAAPGEPDAARRLSRVGESEARKVGKALRRLGVAPDRIVTSPLPRARRTAEIVAERLGLEDRLEPAEVLGTAHGADEIRAWLAGRGEPSLLVVGHNPALGELVPLLAGADPAGFRFDLKKGGVAAFRARPYEPFALRWVATPRLLARLLG